MADFNLHAERQFESPGHAAVIYKSLGMEPLVLPAREKKPKGKWGNLAERSDADLLHAFSHISNIGIALGERSGALADIDFDRPEAALIGREIFSDLPSFGRLSSPYSHRFASSKLRKNIRFQIPSNAAELFPDGRMTVMELRGDGLQTMVPPSVHPSEEQVRWHDSFEHIPKVDPADLERRSGYVAFLAIILNKYPRFAGNRDNICLALTGALVLADISNEEVDSWVTLVATLANDEEADKRSGKAQASRGKHEAGEQIWGLPTLCKFLGIEPMESTLRNWLGLLSNDGSSSGAITVRGGFLPQAVDAAEQALIREGVGIFQRYDNLVRVVPITTRVDEERIGRDSGALVLKPVPAPWLREQFARVARWEQPMAKDKGMKRIDPPQDIAATYLARVGEWKLRFLQGITQSPTLRIDGTVLQEPGYDAASGLLYDPRHVAFPLVPETPTKAQAESALVVLAAPFRGFAFAEEADRSVALAAVLTALVRAMFPAAPLFALDAPTAGSGKSLLAETIGIIATGHKPAMMSQGKTDEENEKRLASVLMAGDQVMVIDNCRNAIEGDFLCTMLTQELVQPRILGKSEMRRLPTRCLVMATGNNLTLSGDVTRRALMCRLDSGIERPDQRQFDFDPRDEVSRDRPLLVAAGLTILRAYLAADRPNLMEKIGSFEKWNIIREALVWLDAKDPAITRDRVLADDPQKEVLLDLLKLWREALADRQVTLTELAHIADKGDDIAVRKLVDELSANTRFHGSFNPRSVGRFLAKHLDRVAGGLVLQAAGDASGIKRYRSLLRDSAMATCRQVLYRSDALWTGVAGFEGFGGFLQAALGWQTCQTHQT